MLILVLVILDSLGLIVFALFEHTLRIYLPQPLLFVLIWIPPTAIILFFILFQLGVFLRTRSKRKSSSKIDEYILIESPAAKQLRQFLKNHHFKN
jgi:hypothetical protein